MAKLLKNPMLWFFLVAFGMPWLGWSSIYFFDVQASPWRTALFYTGDFCSIGGLVAMYVQGGKAGAVELLKRCVRWRVSALWWGIVFAIPLLTGLVGYLIAGAMHEGTGSFVLSGFSMYFAPRVLMNFTTGPWGEELGWRGFLTPKLLETQNAVVASLIVGFLWGIWHLPLYITSAFSTFEGGLSFTISTMLTSVIMTAILLHTRGSVLVAVIYHWLLNATSMTLPSVFPEFDAEAANVYLYSEIGVKAVIVAIFILILGPNLTRNPRSVI